VRLSMDAAARLKAAKEEAVFFESVMHQLS